MPIIWTNKIERLRINKTPIFWAKVSTNGWVDLNHTEEWTHETLGEWFLPIVYIILHSLARGFVGTDHSTFSLVSAWRVEDYPQFLFEREWYINTSRLTFLFTRRRWYIMKFLYMYLHAIFWIGTLGAEVSRMCQSFKTYICSFYTHFLSLSVKSKYGS